LGLSVAPFTGAWIETIWNESPEVRCVVAPFTGAWIETQTVKENAKEYESRPSRARGLKRAGVQFL